MSKDKSPKKNTRIYVSPEALTALYHLKAYTGETLQTLTSQAIIEYWRRLEAEAIDNK